MQATGRSQNRIVLRSPWQNLETFALASQIGATPKGKNLREQILSFWSSPYFENDELFPLKAVPYGKEAKKKKNKYIRPSWYFLFANVIQ